MGVRLLDDVPSETASGRAIRPLYWMLNDG
jgi:hypothetical protein